jgi:acid phosphatase
MKTFTSLLALSLMLLSTTANANHFNKVLVIVFENTDYKKAIMQPYFSQLMKEGAIFSNFKAVTHPSQGNYVAMIAGSTFGIKDDKNIDLNERHIGDLLEESKRDWKVYAEGFPGNCFTDRTSGNYSRKHVPFLSFTNVTKNPARCSKIVEAKEFFSDFEASKLKDFSMFIPNLKDDGHDTGVSYGDVWLKKNFDSIFIFIT